MRTTIIDPGTNFARRGFIIFEKLAVGFVKGFGQQFRLGVLEHIAEVLEGRRQGEEFAKAVPAQEIFFGKLLHMLGRGATRAGFKQSSAIEQWHDGQHFCRSTDFQDGKQIGQVIAQHIAGY